MQMPHNCCNRMVMLMEPLIGRNLIWVHIRVRIGIVYPLRRLILIEFIFSKGDNQHSYRHFSILNPPADLV